MLVLGRYQCLAHVVVAPQSLQSLHAGLFSEMHGLELALVEYHLERPLEEEEPGKND